MGTAPFVPTAGLGGRMVVVDAWVLVIGLMLRVLDSLDIKYAPVGNTGDPSGATDSRKRPDAMLFLTSILMFKVIASVWQQIWHWAQGGCPDNAGYHDIAGMVLMQGSAGTLKLWGMDCKFAGHWLARHAVQKVRSSLCKNAGRDRGGRGKL